MIGLIGEEAHRVCASVEQVLAMRRAVRCSAAELARLKEREREVGRSVAREISGNSAPAEAPSYDSDVDLNHRRIDKPYAVTVRISS
jgi:hypothetical protein